MTRALVDQVMIHISQLLNVLFDFVLSQDYLIAVGAKLDESVVAADLHILIQGVVVLDKPDFVYFEEALYILDLIIVPESPSELLAVFEVGLVAILDQEVAGLGVSLLHQLEGRQLHIAQLGVILLLRVFFAFFVVFKMHALALLARYARA